MRLQLTTEQIEAIVYLNMTRGLKRKKDPGTILAMVMGIALFLLMVLYLYNAYGEQLRELFHVLSLGNEDEFEEYIRTQGMLKGLAFLVIAVLIQVVSIVIPAIIVHVAAGVIYGWWIAFLTCYISFVLANLLVFEAARHMRRQITLEGMSVSPRLLNKLNDGDPVFTIALCYLVPGVPNGIIPHIAGHSDLTVKQFLAAIMSTTWIQILLNCVIGHFLIRGQYIYMFLSFALQFGIIFLVSANKNTVMELFERALHIN